MAAELLDGLSFVLKLAEPADDLLVFHTCCPTYRLISAIVRPELYSENQKHPLSASLLSALPP